MTTAESKATQPIIFLDDVHVTFKTRTGSILHPNKVKAVQGVTMKLMPGETIGIVGESGCGKSTTAKVICGLQAPTSGLDALPGQLSGGQRQRVAIARALSLKPDAIVADEPTSALDVSVRAQILNLLTDLKKDLGLSMVFISHDIQTVRYISDRIMVMNGGKCVESGPAQDVFNNPQDAYTRKLLGAAPSLLHPDLGQAK